MYLRISAKLRIIPLLLALLFGCTAPAVKAAAPVNKTKAVTKTTIKTTTEKPANKTVKPAATPEVTENFVDVTPEELVDKPQEYLNKNVKFTAKFFAFSSLALDYKPAMRSSKAYLSFLILRSHSHIPLSELKLALLIPKEKDPENQLIAVLKDGDTVELSGHVFSAALGEPWMDVQHIKKIGGGDDKEKTTEADTSSDQESKDKSSSESTTKQSPETKHEPSKPGAQ